LSGSAFGRYFLPSDKIIEKHAKTLVFLSYYGIINYRIKKIEALKMLNISKMRIGALNTSQTGNLLAKKDVDEITATAVNILSEIGIKAADEKSLKNCA